MSKPVEPFDLYRIRELQFGVAEAAEITEVTEKTLYNWNARGVIKIRKDPYSGRGVFGPADLLQISLIKDLAFHCRVDPAHSAAMASKLVDKWRERCEGSKPLGGRLTVHISLQNGGSPMIFYFEDAEERERFPHLTVSLDILASDLADAMFNFLRDRPVQLQPTRVETRKLKG